MICQNCQQNEATIHLYANVNGQKTTGLLPKLLSKIKNQANNSLKIWDKTLLALGV